MGGVGDRDVKIVMTLNIRHGGGDRVALIVKTIATWSPDTVVITEYRNGRVGELLRSSLAVAGWEHQVAAPTPERHNSVLIVGRQPVKIDDRPLSHADWQRDRHLVVRTSTGTIVAVYLPPGPSKLPSWARLLITAAALATEPTLIIGDFNTGKHHIDEEGATFLGPEYIDRIEELGYTDAWRTTHQATRDYTWFSSAGNGFRLDYAFLSPALAPRLARAEHIHKPRHEAVTDHSGLLVEIDEYAAQQSLAADTQRLRC